MNVLVVKTSSLGDVLHSLPALTDAGKHCPGIRFDWVVEQCFADVPTWHPLVDEVIPVFMRKWRQHPLEAIKRGEIKHFVKRLRRRPYDLIIDAQGLLKSSWITALARGKRCGLDGRSAWESLSTVFYGQRYSVSPDDHAVTRVRSLFAQALGYDLPQTVMDYDLHIKASPRVNEITEAYVMLLHGTTWKTKHWPERYWIDLAKKIESAGLIVVLPWGNDAERMRSERIAGHCHHAMVLPKLGLSQVCVLISKAHAVVGGDTGLGHIATALRVPTILLYGPTDPQKIGTFGPKQLHLATPLPCSPCWKGQCAYKGKTDVFPACFTDLTPTFVWQQLSTLMERTDS